MTTKKQLKDKDNSPFDPKMSVETITPTTQSLTGLTITTFYVLRSGRICMIYLKGSCTQAINGYISLYSDGTPKGRASVNTISLEGKDVRMNTSTDGIRFYTTGAITDIGMTLFYMEADA